VRKTVSVIAALAITLWVGTLLIGRLGAQETQDDARPAAKGALSDSTLLQMLTDLGYEPKKLKQGYVVAIKKDEWTYNVQFVISPNREKLGLNANMGTVDDPAAITATQWMSVLAANTDIAPSFFYYNKAKSTLYVHRVLDNRCLSSTILRQQVEAFTNNIKETEDVWKFTK
jgi:hypothetical protein